MKKVTFKIPSIKKNNHKKSNIFIHKRNNSFPIKFKKTYTMKKASNVAIRIHDEIENPIKFRKRFYKEKIVEKLLINNNMFIQANKVYRLSDYNIDVLLYKLVKN